ncbi:ankyrin repeat domain-containing protein [Aspergillus homomorphus CBS 101889]|uniref:Ankyrin n=1 Tax=Aspergillus homomorphus (strain CBS 101889) TaxID=1450537 RepID=A0A395IA58_ASPHC|nr:ankyrin [Aspergillus homomorphus CBS 101889]RAL17140.1 ankyrin [Aspergillus homomorphus CBS 101889]
MSLDTLPNELLLQLESYIDSQADLAVFLQISSRVYSLLVANLYQRNASAALLYGVQKSLYSTALKALQAGADRNVKSRDKERPVISLAAENGSLEIIRLLLEVSLLSPSPVDLNIFDKNRYTALFLAATHGHASIVELLLAHGANPNLRESTGRTALFMAAIRGHTAVVRTLLAYHDDPRQPDLEIDVVINQGETALLAAARQGHTEIVFMLFKRGASLGTNSRTTVQPVLHSAVLHRQPELLRLVVNRDEIDPNRIHRNRTALGLAVANNDEDLAAILLTDPRVNPDLTLHPGGQTPLMQAILKNNERLIQLLRDAGANPRIMTRLWVSPAMFLEAPTREARQELIDKHYGFGVRLAQDWTLG